MKRRFAIAALVSLGVHASLLLPAVWLLRHTTPRAMPASSSSHLLRLQVMSRSRAPEGVGLVAQTEARPRGVPAVRVAKQTPGSAEATSAAPPAEESSAPSETAAAPAERSADQPDQPGGSADQRGPPAGDATSAAPPTGAGVPTGPDLEAELHRLLQASAARCYPSASKRFHEVGTSEVSFCVERGGTFTRSKLGRSSGSERLDAAAVDCVVAGSGPLASAAGRCFTVPVHFGD